MPPSEIREATGTRRPRFIRAPTSELCLTPRDLDLVRAVAVHRFLRSTHLIALSEGSPQKILRRLNLLYHHAYLDRPRLQLDFYERGSEPMIYALGNRGADLLASHDGTPKARVNWGSKNRSATRAFLKHTLLISDLMVGMELGCRALGEVRLIPSAEILSHAPQEIRNRRQPLGWRVRLREGREALDLGLVPDQVFGLRFENEPEGRNRAFFFLEADRGSMPLVRSGLLQTSVYRKLLSYAETWRQGLHTARFGIRHFRVLTVTTSPERVRHLLKVTERLHEGGAPLFLFTDCGSLLSGNPLTHPWVNGLGELTRLID